MKKLYRAPDNFEIWDFLVKIWQSRRLYLIILPIVLVVSAVYEYSLPSVYKCEVTLLPEAYKTSSSGESKKSHLFSFTLLDDPQQDAISPINLAQIVMSRDFLCELYNIKVSGSNVKDITYFEYLLRHQQYPWWDGVSRSIKRSLGLEKTRILNAEEALAQEQDPQWESKPDVYRLTMRQEAIRELLSTKILCDLDEKTAAFSYAVFDQDPEIAQQMADSIRVHLDWYIHRYRMNRILSDMESIDRQLEMQWKNYVDKRESFARWADLHGDIANRPGLRVMSEQLEKELDQTFQIYNIMLVNQQAIHAKAESYSPAFLVMVSPSLPQKPHGPKRNLYIIVALFATFVLISIWVLRKDLLE